MADYIKFNGSGKITKKYKSVDGANIKDLPDILKVDSTVFDSITKFHKVSGGQVVEMTQPEKDNVLQEEQNVIVQAEIDRIDNLNISMTELVDVLISFNVINKTKQELAEEIKLNSPILNP